jgi:hypothetical protein
MKLRASRNDGNAMDGLRATRTRGSSTTRTSGANSTTSRAYIIDLLKRVVCVSLETLQIVAKLPALNER